MLNKYYIATKFYNRKLDFSRKLCYNIVEVIAVENNKWYIGKISLQDNFIHFDVDEVDLHIRFRVASTMSKIIRVKNNEDGWLTVDAHFENIGVEEDYIDVKDVVKKLGLDTKVFKRVKKVVIV